MKNKKVIFWTKGIDALIKDENKFNGGAAVQMLFWAKTFCKNNWKVYTFSEKQKFSIDDIIFFKFPSFSKIGILLEIFFTIYFFLKINPDVIIRRGASRNLFFTALFSKIFCKKLIFMAAHDTDFDTGNEIINYRYNKRLYKWGLHMTNRFVTQNHNQSQNLEKNYKKIKYLLIPNIWNNNFIKEKKQVNNKNYLLWVGNFSNRKRPDWFMQLAKENENKKFVMVGGPGSLMLFNQCKINSQKIKNLIFHGPQKFSHTNSLFLGAKIFYCTSESEGFPNTFLQAWSNNIPVISSFDPSDIIKKNNLGIVVTCQEDMRNATKNLLTNSETYIRIQNNIKSYFSKVHDSESAFKKLITFHNLNS